MRTARQNRSGIMSIDLKPCPFCGNDQIYSEQTVTDGSVWCHEGCRARITYKHSPAKDDGMLEAISAWNRRHK